MFEILQSLIIGAIQGITEFLPISSSAHLVLAPYIFGWDYKGLNFDVALHLGTVIAILFYFWKDWTILITEAISNLKFKISNLKSISNDKLGNDKLMEIDQPASPAGGWKMENRVYPPNLLWQIIIATIPAAIVGYLISDYVESTLHSPILLASNLIIFGIILYLVDRLTKKSEKILNISYKQSFLVGLAQSLALVPGISRSGITMIAGRSLGLSRESAARFSFLLGTPAMLGAFVFELKNLSFDNINAPFIFGVISSTVFGFLAIKYLLEYLKRGNFSVFMWYRILLATVVLIIYFMR